MDQIEGIPSCLSGMCKYLLISACSGILGLLILVATVPFLSGFTVGGIAAGSLAAWMMACHAGYTPVGGFVAMMQSIRAMGIAAGLNLYTCVLGCILGLVLGGCWAFLQENVCVDK